MSLRLSAMEGTVLHDRGSRVAKSIAMAATVAPVAILAACGVLAYSERAAVCREKALREGRDAVQVISCNDTARNGLVLLSCPISQDDFLTSQWAGHIGDIFKDLVQPGVGVHIKTEMLQCMETVSKADESGSGASSEGNASSSNDESGASSSLRGSSIYSHEVTWMNSSEDSSQYQVNLSSWKDICGVANPAWPAGLPEQGLFKAKTIHVGDFNYSIKGDEIPLNTPVAWQAPAGWTQEENDYFMSTQWMENRNSIGKMRVQILSNDWRKAHVTLLGNNVGGSIVEWRASSTWMCSEAVHEFQEGNFTTEELFSKLESEKTTVAWLVRSVVFAVLWLSFSCCFAPLETITEGVPCVGQCLSDAIAAIGCCLAFIPAVATFMIVFGAVWFVMRPAQAAAVLLIGLGLGVCVCMFFTMAVRRQKAREMLSFNEQAPRFQPDDEDDAE